MYLIIFIVLVILIYIYINQEHHKVHPYGYPYLIEKDDFLSETICEQISKNLLESSYTVKDQGFSVYFDDAPDIEENFIKHDLKCIYDIFKSVREPKTNSYVCNVMLVPVCNDDSDKEVSVGGHYDGSAEVTDIFGKYYMPLCTSVVYLQVPKSFTGGELYLKKHEHDGIYKEIPPKPGKYVRFRGDMFHGVNRIYSNDKTYRLSIVFEQYIIPVKKPKFVVQDIFTEYEYDETTGTYNYL